MGRKNIQRDRQTDVALAEAALRRLLSAIHRVAATPERFTAKERRAIVNVIMAAVDSENDLLAINGANTMLALDTADIEALKAAVAMLDSAVVNVSTST